MPKITLKAARVNAELSVETAANLLGIKARSLYNYETGRSRVPAGTLLLMSKVYGIPVDLFILPNKFGDTQQQQNTEDAK